jgi:hypothetical protein
MNSASLYVCCTFNPIFFNQHIKYSSWHSYATPAYRQTTVYTIKESATAKERPPPTPHFSMQAAVWQKHANRRAEILLPHRQIVRVTAYRFIAEKAISNNFDYESETAVQGRVNLIFCRTPVQMTQCRMSVFNHITKNGPENCRKIHEHPEEWSDQK